MADISQQWAPVQEAPLEGDTIRWIEPIWAAPNKPRGKPDKVGEQFVTAKVISAGEIYELSVIAVENCDPKSSVAMKIKQNDQIRRKETSLARSDCHKLVKE